MVRAIGESASLRNLANAARVMEGNPALMNLCVRQSLAAAQNISEMLVLGTPAGFVPFKNGKAGLAHSDTSAKMERKHCGDSESARPPFALQSHSPVWHAIAKPNSIGV